MAQTSTPGTPQDVFGETAPSELTADEPTAYGRMTKVLALTIPERETIIRALDDAPPGLEELRAVLLREHVGRVRDGLV